MPIEKSEWTKFLAAVEGVAGLDMRRAWYDRCRGVEVAGHIVRISAPNAWWAHWMRTDLAATSLAAAKRVWPQTTAVWFSAYGSGSPSAPSRAPSLIDDRGVSDRFRAGTEGQP